MKPSASEVSFFLSQYGLDDSVRIEQIDIEQDDKFEFYMFAFHRPASISHPDGETSLAVYWPK